MRSNTLRLGIVVALIVCLALPGLAVAKKKKKKRGPVTAPVDITKVVSAPIPDKAPGVIGADGILASTIDVAGKQLNGRLVRDVNVTIQTLGATGTNPATGLQAVLVAPSGARTYLFGGLTAPAGQNAVSIGPLTLDDEAFFDLGGGNPINAGRLYSPWLGAATPGNPLVNAIRYSLASLDGGPVTGTWKLLVYDLITGQTSNLVSWRLNVLAGKPFKTK